MRVMLLTPGTGHYYCGSCLRDDALGRALRKLGHVVDVVPLYLPMVLEQHEREQAPVHMGGINVYLQQKSKLARWLPRFVANWLDNPRLLRWVSRRSSMTNASDLGPITVSILRGEDGRQAKEIDKLIEWVATQPRPDVVIVSNALLIGVVRRLRAAFGVPVVVTLQGEAPFLDTLPEVHRNLAWQVVRERAAEVDALIAVSHAYGGEMQQRLGLLDEQLHVVHNGIDLDGLTDHAAAAGRRPKTIGYLARMCRDKGLDTLVDAFLALHQRGTVEGLRLRVAGVQLGEDRVLVDELRGRIAQHGCADLVEFLPNIERTDKLSFLRTLSVLSVPARYTESFGLYLLEAMAAGVPVVQPDHAAFPEIVNATGGGVLCQPGSVTALCDALESLLTNETLADELGARGRASVVSGFTAGHMAEAVAAICGVLVRDNLPTATN